MLFEYCNPLLVYNTIYSSVYTRDTESSLAPQKRKKNFCNKYQYRLVLKNIIFLIPQNSII